MSWFKGILARTRSIAAARASESRMDEEFRFHVDMETKRLVDQQGLPPDEARRKALVAFGGLDAHREEMRDGRGARWFDDLGADLRYALRAMRRAPGFAVAVALTLGVGIGVNGIVFGYVDSLLFRRIPARDPDALVSMFLLDAKTKQVGPGQLRGLRRLSHKERRVRRTCGNGRHSVERSPSPVVPESRTWCGARW